jgi:hypothetical protein
VPPELQKEALALVASCINPSTRASKFNVVPILDFIANGYSLDPNLSLWHAGAPQARKRVSMLRDIWNNEVVIYIYIYTSTPLRLHSVWSSQEESRVTEEKEEVTNNE